MSVFLDTGILVAEANEKDSLHTRAVQILNDIKIGAYGNWICTSDYVFDESVTLAFARTGKMELSKNLAKRILSSNSINLLFVSEDIFKESSATYISQQGKLSFTDCTTIELMKQNGINFIATFDSGFKEVGGIKVVS